jgi:hypothetical protein
LTPFPCRIGTGLRLLAPFVAATGGAVLLPRLRFALPITRLRLLPLRTLPGALPLEIT